MGNAIEKVFEGFVVRCEILEDDEILFVAKDICDAIGVADNSSALRRIDDDEKGVLTVRTPGGFQEMTALREDGVYELLMTSRVEKAKQARKWFKSVLRDIRKTGSYNSITPPSMTHTEVLLATVQQLLNIERQQDEIIARQAITEEKTAGLLVDVEEIKGGIRDLNAVPFKTMRAEINQLVRRASGGDSRLIGKKWNNLYSEFLSRFRVNLKARAKNDNSKSPLDWAEKNGHLRHLYNLAVELYEGIER